MHLPINPKWGRGADNKPKRDDKILSFALRTADFHNIFVISKGTTDDKSKK
jgi:hypothetical protein